MPYAPGISYDNSGLMRGILQGSAGIAAGLERYQEQKKAIVQNSKYAEGLFKTNPEIQKRLGMSEDEFKALSAQDKIALSSGAIASIHNEVEQMKAKESAQAIETAKQHQAYFQQLNEQNTSLQKFGADYAAGPQQFNLDNSAPGNQADILQQYSEPTPQARILNALKRNPAAFASPQFDNSVQGLQRFTTPPKVKMNPALGEVIDLKDGGRILGMGPENPPHYAADLRPPKEQAVHKNYPWLNSTSEAEVKKGLDAIKDPDAFAQAVKDRTAVLHSREDPFKEMGRRELEKSMQERVNKNPSLFERWFGGGTKATAPAAPAPAASAYPKGLRVKQGNAIFEWDGQRFVPVKTQ